jgi:hypothetical protein
MALLAAPAAAAAQDGFTLWPIYSRHADPTDGAVETRVLGPLAWRRAGAREVTYGLRPLFAGRRARDEETSELAILSPLAAYRRQGGDRELTALVRLLTWRAEAPPDGGPPATEFTLFPFLFGRSGGGAAGYGGLLPLYVRLRDRLGFDEAEAVLFPLYARTVSLGQETRHVLFPFFAAYGGDGRRGFKAWPLYGEESAPGRLERRFLLWPVYHAQRTGLDGDSPQEARLVLPFFARVRSPSRQYTAVLPPLFGYTADGEAGWEQWDLAWPLGQVARGDGRQVVRAFPVYGRARRGEREDRFFLWPLFARSTDAEREERRAYLRLLLVLYQDERATGAGGEVSERRLDAWPLLTFRRERDGRARLHAPSLLEPLLRRDVGASELYGPLLHLFAYREGPGGAWVASLLWDLVRGAGDGRGVAWAFLGPVLSYRADGNGGQVVSILGGLLEAGRAGAGGHLRVLYLPAVRWGPPASPAGEARAGQGATWARGDVGPPAAGRAGDAGGG